ncbi:WbqC family protein [Pseudomonas sp. BMS12]|uniref:WbqC family protein n=1 Tax=Pseudomonas sp. BMS12 TaxID=1796033 RepID=UPI000ADFF49B|nr:WbqC family protein [Pseudomonas sp. BMS12]
MKLGIMQPYFFPYLGHFSLIAHTDRWVVFDVTQYTPKSWMSRNRVLHPQSGWNYVNLPLSNSSISILTREARVQSMEKSRTSILGKLTHYRRKAPFYQQVTGLVSDVFSSAGDDSLVRLNTRGLAAVCRYLELPFEYSICSELALDPQVPDHPGAWAPAISRQLGADTYINPMGGRALFDSKEFSLHSVELQFLEFSEFRYDTAPYVYEPGLSILDVLMWNPPQTVREALFRNARIIEA